MSNVVVLQGRDVAARCDPEPQLAVIANRYQLLGRLGQGGTGSVYRARDLAGDLAGGLAGRLAGNTGRVVALKLLLPGELDIADDEAELLASIHHPNVVGLLDYGRFAGHRYLVLELLEGRDFQAWLGEQPTTTQIVDNFIEAGRGLAAAHAAGLVHGDVKPSNFMLTHAGRVAVIDFGLAQVLDSMTGEREPHASAPGTLAYIAPERIAGHDNDARSDQFGFCVALWEALTDTDPFTGDRLEDRAPLNPLARNQAIRRGSLRLAPGDRANPWAAVLSRGMAYAPSDRFADMQELLDELERTRPRPLEQSARPVLGAIALVGVLAVGWGLTPDSPVVDEAHSHVDPTTSAALALLSKAETEIATKDMTGAAKDLMYAAELMQEVEPGSENYCAFAGAIPPLGELFLEHEAAAEARLAFAIAVNLAQHCAGLDAAELELRQEAAAARMRAPK